MKNKPIKLYTKTGDKGESGLADGVRATKSDLVFEVLGGLDELNSHLGVTLVEAKKSINSKLQITNELMKVQNNLLVLGAVVAGSEKVKMKESDVDFLEERIDYYQKNTREDWYTKFLLPGGTELAARIDVARAVARRVERVMVGYKIQNSKLKITNNKVLVIEQKYLNRLSDYLFALRCFVNSAEGYEESKFEV